MPIHLITGLPGDGKTTTMVSLLAKKAKEGKRPLAYWGIEGLKPGYATQIEDIREWNAEDPDGEPTCDCHQDGRLHAHKVPDGSLIFVDEAWKAFGHLQNAARQQTPQHVLALAEHRHRGIDFVWTSQAPVQLYPFARSMIGEHWHVVRKFGTSMQEIYKWGELVEDVKSQAMRDRAVKEITTIKSDTFDLFKSASEHTIKAKIPWKVWALPVLLIAAVAMIWWTFLLLRPDAMAVSLPEGEASGLPDAPHTGQESTRGGKGPKIESLDDWLERLAMRAPGLHGSQPVFDDRNVQAEPRTFCVMSGGDEGDDRCRCYTEQATRLFDVRDDVCRHMARWGGYDPFLAPMEGQEPQVAEEAPPQTRRGAIGTPTKPGTVGSDRMGEVWGKKPETLRTSNVGG